MDSLKKITEQGRIPWPGPRPYGEEDWKYFFGRGPDLEELHARVQVNKLTLLFGGSGVGKTSLIRAGLVPFLRLERYHPRGDQRTWPVLLLRRWGNLGSGSLEENLVCQLEWAVDAIEEWGKRLLHERALTDAENLRRELDSFRRSMSRDESMLDVIETLARSEARRCSEKAIAEDSGEAGNSSGGLILIFDQFEEQLRAGTQARDRALELIANIVRSNAPTRVLISMRREYQYTLRRLELMVGSFSGRSFFLTPMEAPTVVEVVTECSSTANIPIDQDVALRVVRWLTSHEDLGTRPSLDERESRPDEVEGSNDRGHPDLLHLQAVLFELSRYVLCRQQEQVTMPLFEEFSSQFGVSGGGRDTEGVEDGCLAERVLGGALERWFESALGGASQEVRDDQHWVPQDAKIRSHAEWVDIPPEDLRLQVRRIAVRLAPHVSSGDYKVAQEENTLFRQAVGDEIARLGLKDPELRSRIRIIEDQNGPPRLNWEELQLSEEHPQGQVHLVSGLARVRDWSSVETGDKILLCFKETLHRLAMSNILQYTQFGEDKRIYWELVHH